MTVSVSETETEPVRLCDGVVVSVYDGLSVLVIESDGVSEGLFVNVSLCVGVGTTV